MGKAKKGNKNLTYAILGAIALYILLAAFNVTLFGYTFSIGFNSPSTAGINVFQWGQLSYNNVTHITFQMGVSSYALTGAFSQLAVDTTGFPSGPISSAPVYIQDSRNTSFFGNMGTVQPPGWCLSNGMTCTPYPSQPVLNYIAIYINGKLTNKISAATSYAGSIYPSSWTQILSPSTPSSEYGSNICNPSTLNCWWYMLNITPTTKYVNVTIVLNESGTVYSYGNIATNYRNIVLSTSNTIVTSYPAATTTTTIMGATTTITQCSGSCSPPLPPPNPNLIQILQNYFNSFINFLNINFRNYFTLSVATAPNTFSIAVTNTTSRNITQIGNTIVGTISLSINPANESTAWAAGINKLTRTYCQTVIKNTNNSQIIYNSTVVNMSGKTTLTTVQAIKTSTTGIILFGGACQTTTDTFSTSLNAWQGWTPYANLTNQQYAVLVTPPETLTLTANPTAGGTLSTNPTGSPYFYGTIVTISETAALGYNFTGWTGTGIGSYTGTKQSPSLVMNNSISEVAGFKVIGSGSAPLPPPAPNILQSILNFFSNYSTCLGQNGYGAIFSCL